VLKNSENKYNLKTENMCYAYSLNPVKNTGKNSKISFEKLSFENNSDGKK
jgi:hypothetical protein